MHTHHTPPTPRYLSGFGQDEGQARSIDVRRSPQTQDLWGLAGRMCGEEAGIGGGGECMSKYVHGAIGIGGSQSSKLVLTWGGTWKPKAEGAGRFQAL